MWTSRGLDRKSDEQVETLLESSAPSSRQWPYASLEEFALTIELYNLKADHGAIAAA